MSRFALIAVEKDYKVNLSEGKVTVGRGPFLQITDKRVSRNHAVLEVSDVALTILPIHSNPTFYKACGETNFEPLEKGQAKELANGDCIAFLPNDLFFKVEIKDNVAIAESEPIVKISDGAVKVSDKEEDSSVGSSKENEVEKPEDGEKIAEEITENVSSREVIKVASIDKRIADMEQADVHSDESDESSEDYHEEVERPARTLNKTRVLPSWMTKDKGKTPRKTSKKVEKTKKEKGEDAVELIPDKKVEDPEESKNDSFRDGNNDAGDKNTEHIEKEQTDDVEMEEQELSHVSQDTEGEDKKRKREDIEETEQSSKRDKKLPRCPYGGRCYRKNPVHLQEYSHDETTEESENEDEVRDDLPECPYGEYCYRKNPRHRKEYKHTPQPKARERRAKTKAGAGRIRDDDDDGPNDYDYEDSFIDDESESSGEPSNNDDSDWQPPDNEQNDDDDDDDENVKELLSEARNFTRNKKMLKPT